MPLFGWKDEFSVKVGLFDTQHKKLIDMVNELYDAMKAGKGSDVLGKIFLSLAEYTANHFKDEENLMLQHKYSDYYKHKKEHDELTTQVAELKQKFTDKKMFVTIELMNFLKDWLLHHIMETDKSYGDYFNEKGVK